MQIAPGVPLHHLTWIARYAAEKEVDTVVQLGDWAEMHSLSSYDSKAKKAVDGADVAEDFGWANAGWDRLEDEWERLGWRPTRRVYLLGNHEQRIERYVADNHELRGYVNYDAFVAGQYGWEVVPFLEVKTVDGIAYSHFFPRNANGKVFQSKHGAPNARAQVIREMRSCSAGHTPGLDTAIYTAGDRMFRGAILGSSYLHRIPYHPDHGYWRGILLKHNVVNGNYNLCEVPLAYLEAKYA